MKNPKAKFNIKSNVMFFLVCIVWCFFNLNTFAQKCKTDFSRASRIDQTKNVKGWMGDLYNASLKDVVISDELSKLQVTLLFGIEQDSLIFVALAIKKAEGPSRNAQFEDHLRAARGNEFILSCKGGEPLHFVAANILNKTEMDGVWDEYARTVLLVDYISDERLPLITNSLNDCLISAFTIKLENNVIIDQPVMKKFGERIKNKAPCFESFLREIERLE